MNNPQAAFLVLCYLLYTLHFLLLTFIILPVELAIKGALNLINLLIG